jgi:uncharacterized protein YecE (DUF72 family)
MFHIGTMGYGYKDWHNGVFYPNGMRSPAFLAHYSSIFNAVEMDTTYYGTPPADRVQKWAASVPFDFTFSPKTPKIITHEHRLTGDALPLMAQFTETMRLFGEKLGVILIQFPPDFSVEEMPALNRFLPHLPPDLRFAVEFRHSSWYKRATSELLQAHGVAWASTDYIYLPKQVHVTANFIYLRLLGKHGNFKVKDKEKVDSTPLVTWWAEQLQPHLESVRDVFVFANNDYAGHSPTTANKLKQVLNLPTVPTRPPQQGTLF